MIGTTIGDYRIEAEAGAGGMGVVYRAVDTKLRRPVAIKVLNPAAAGDPERKRRFIQEAQAASALAHSDIVTIYQIGSEGAIDYIAMEFVAGRPLDAVIAKRPLPLKDVLRIGRRVADALAAAHKAGIVHRDLKPANVMITDTGGVKLLDFGVAKLTEPDVAHESNTMTMRAPTAAGLIVGTPAYMSPEQREGEPVDARSDIYSFGLLLFEMFTGRRPPQGELDPASLATAPRDLRRIVGRCLRRLPAERFQVMDDVRLALEDVDAVETPAASAPARRGIYAVAVVGLAALAAAGVLFWKARSAPETRPMVLTRLTSDPGLSTDPALSGDGRLLAFASDRGGNGSLDIWVRQVAGGAPVRLTDDPADDREPTFSPDGTQIAFESDRGGGGIYVVPTFGGEARRIADQCHRPRWSPASNQIVCWTGVNTGYLLARADAPRIFLVAAAGQEPRRLFADFAVAWGPVWSPDGKQMLFVGERKDGDPADWWIADADGSSPRPTSVAAALARARLNPPNAVFIPDAWTASGHVLFMASLGNPNVLTLINDSINLWRIPIDGAGQPRGSPERITTAGTLDTHPSAAADGTIAFSSVRQNVDLWSLPIDAATGKPTGAAENVTDDPAFDAYPTLPADDSRLVFLSNRSGRFELWMKEGQRQTVLGSEATYPSVPTVSQDGTLAIYSSGDPPRNFIVPTRPGPRVAMTLVACQDCDVLWDLTADKRAIVYTRADASIQVRDLATGKTTQLTAAPGDIIGRLRLSPDNRWLVFNHRAGGLIRLTVVPFTPDTPVTRDQWIPVTPENTVVNAGIWSPDGSLLYFLSDADGHVCVWAEPIDHQTGKVAGDAFPVWHFHEARRSMASLPLPSRAIGLSRSRLVVSLAESAGNVWLAK